MRTNFVFLLFFLVSVQNRAQDQIFRQNEGKLWHDFTYDMANVFGGVGYSYSRPLHWGKGGFLRFGAVTAATGTLFLLDDEIRHSFLGHRDEVPQILLDYGYEAGSPKNNYGLTGAIYLTGLFTKNEKLRRTGVLLISSATAAGIVQQITKSALGRARPGAGLGNHHFKPFGGTAAYHSFPSGHAVLTFTNAYAIAKQFSNGWVKAGILGVGLIPGLSRIYDEAHWASDVFLSWALSAFIVEAIDNYLDMKYRTKYVTDSGKEKKVDYNLVFSGNRMGLVIQF